MEAFQSSWLFWNCRGARPVPDAVVAGESQRAVDEAGELPGILRGRRGRGDILKDKADVARKLDAGRVRKDERVAAGRKAGKCQGGVAGGVVRPAVELRGAFHAAGGGLGGFKQEHSGDGDRGLVVAMQGADGFFDSAEGLREVRDGRATQGVELARKGPAGELAAACGEQIPRGGRQLGLGGAAFCAGLRNESQSRGKKGATRP